jgi:hypothetical protein
VHILLTPENRKPFWTYPNVLDSCQYIFTSGMLKRKRSFVKERAMNSEGMIIVWWHAGDL